MLKQIVPEVLMLDEMCYDSKARPIRERKMPENLTHIETLARAHTDAAIKTLAEIMMDPSAPARVSRKAAAGLARYASLARSRVRLRYDHIVAEAVATAEFKHGQFHVKPTG